MYLTTLVTQKMTQYDVICYSIKLHYFSASCQFVYVDSKCSLFLKECIKIYRNPLIVNAAPSPQKECTKVSSGKLSIWKVYHTTRFDQTESFAERTHSCPNNKFTPYKQSSQHTTSLSGSHTFWHTEKALKGYKGAQLVISKTWSKNI